MVKHINESELDVDFVDVDEQMFGRNYLRQLYGKAEVYNHEQYLFWLNYLESLAISAFEWEGIPAGIDPRAIEYIMLHFGMGAMFREWGGFLFAQASPASNINMYYNPNEILLCAPSGQTWQRHCESWVSQEWDSELNDYLPRIHERDAVMLFDSLLRYPVYTRIKYYAKRLATIDRVIDVNVGAQRTPFILRYPEQAKLAGNATIKALEKNEQAIKTPPSAGGIIDIDVLTTAAPYVAKDLQDTKKQILYDALTFLGVDNSNTEKKERMIDAEATSNQEQILLLRRSRLAARKQFCEQAFNLWGIEINVKWGAPHLQESDGDMTPLENFEESSYVGD